MKISYWILLDLRHCLYFCFACCLLECKWQIIVIQNSRPNYSGVKPVDKREGGGAHNWGNHRDDIEWVWVWSTCAPWLKTGFCTDSHIMIWYIWEMLLLPRHFVVSPMHSFGYTAFIKTLHNHFWWDMLPCQYDPLTKKSNTGLFGFSSWGPSMDPCQEPFTVHLL